MSLQTEYETPFPGLVRVGLYTAEADFLIETLRAAVADAARHPDFSFGDWCAGRLAGLRQMRFVPGLPSAVDITPHEGCLLIQQLTIEEKAATAAGRFGEAHHLMRRCGDLREALR